MREGRGVLPVLAALAIDPSPLARRLSVAGAPFIFRALRSGDAVALTSFLAELSDTSRRFWHGDTDPAVAAAGWIEAIGRYDKLRLVAHRPDRAGQFDAVVDLSFSFPADFEVARYASYGIDLDPVRAVRFGPCVADAWHGSGLAAALLPPTWAAVRLLDRDRVVLFGGVHADNHRARRFYRRCGFLEAGAFTDAGEENIDMFLDLR
ncbi:GNAT family N-acetyltransferase [Actinoplanes regularis]|uniref:GNAT family N-acetyltransferase n=1 Tax=Actinoplanes regularis TaxID=52697 RepID=UPI00255529E4|nr:GNAT family N-acetyltransferase [Actinoplanes regularis]